MINEIAKQVHEKDELDGRYVALSAAVEKSFNTQALKYGHMFMTDIKAGDIKAAFLSGFPEEERQANTCDCCLTFIEKFGRLAVIALDDKEQATLKSAMWDCADQVDPYFYQSLTNMKKLVEKAKLVAVWYSRQEKLGNIEENNFNHLQVVRAVIPDIPATVTPGQLSHESREDQKLLAESPNTFSTELAQKVLNFFKADATLRSRTGHIETLEWFLGLRKFFDSTKNNKLRELRTWFETASSYKNRTHIGQTNLGDFLKNIDKGFDFSLAKKRYLEANDPMTHLRAQTAPTRGNIVRAEKIFEILGLKDSLNRRYSDISEMRNIIWTPKQPEVKKEEDKGLFGHLAAKDDPVETSTPMPALVDGGTMTWVRFKEEVLSLAEKFFIRVYPAPMNFVSVTTTSNPEAKPILQWDKDEDRNPHAPYHYQNGSPAQAWGLTPNTFVEVTSIITMPHDWAEPGAATGDKVTLLAVLEGAADKYMKQIPISASVLRPELHEVRAVMENFFTQGKLDEQPEEFKPFAGLMIHDIPGGPLQYEVHVLHGGNKVRYVIDRYN